MTEAVPRHVCPWPGCPRHVLPWFWGCAPHWAMIPEVLQKEFIRSRNRAADVQPVAHQMAVERIRNWVTENARPDEVRPSMATPDVEAGFSAGFASDGNVLLFWPLEGEYMILGPMEVAVLRRLFGRPA